MADEKKPAAVVEEIKNCPACKKPLRKARRFYRNGGYYCNKNCYAKAVETANEAKAKAEAPAA